MARFAQGDHAKSLSLFDKCTTRKNTCVCTEKLLRCLIGAAVERQSGALDQLKFAGDPRR